MNLNRIVCIASVFLLAFLSFYPTITDAAIQKEAIEVNALSERSSTATDEYNVADAEIVLDYDTWENDLGEDMPTGVFYGSNIEPSIAQLDITAQRKADPNDGSQFALRQMVYFPADVVMSGMYDFYMRVPIVDYDGQIFLCSRENEWNYERAVYLWSVTLDNRTIFNPFTQSGKGPGQFSSLIDVNDDPSKFDSSRMSIINGHIYLKVRALIQPDTHYMLTYIFMIYETLYGYPIGNPIYYHPPASDSELYRPYALFTPENVAFTKGTCQYTTEYKEIGGGTSKWNDFFSDGDHHLNLAVSFLFTKSMSLGNVTVNSYEYTRLTPLNEIHDNTQEVQIIFRAYIENKSTWPGYVSLFIPFICPYSITVSSVQYNVVQASPTPRARFEDNNYTLWDGYPLDMVRQDPVTYTALNFTYRDFMLISSSERLYINGSDTELDVRVNFRINSPLNVPITFALFSFLQWDITAFDEDFGSEYDYVYNQQYTTDSQLSESRYIFGIGQWGQAIPNNGSLAEPVFFNLKNDISISEGQWALVSATGYMQQLSYSHVIRKKIVVSVYVAEMHVNDNGVWSVHSKNFNTYDDAKAYLDELDANFTTESADDTPSLIEKIMQGFQTGFQMFSARIQKIVGTLKDGIDYLIDGLKAVYAFLKSVVLKFVGLIQSIVDFLEENWNQILEVALFLMGIIIGLVGIKLMSAGLLTVETKLMRKVKKLGGGE